jgi:hypothetical protein
MLVQVQAKKVPSQACDEVVVAGGIERRYSTRHYISGIFPSHYYDVVLESRDGKDLLVSAACGPRYSDLLQVLRANRLDESNGWTMIESWETSF